MLKKNRLTSLFLCFTLIFSLFANITIHAEEEMAQRTVLIYICGADLESNAALATANISQILRAGFSADEQVNVVVMTGGSDTWWLDPNDCYIEDGLLINEFYDTSYNRVWEAKGADAKENAGKLVLLDADGITGTPEAPKPAWEELMSDPETLRAFINFGAENYPARKYDLVLWDHGGGATDGFAYDEFDSELRMMSLPQIMDALSANAVTANGGKFDFINFDACLMNSVELNLALFGYTDYYIASAETEPGHGQEYSGWLTKLGDDPDMNGFELGALLNDDFMDFYRDENGNETDYVTLAVVDTNRLMEQDFAGAVSRLSDVLRTQINTRDENNDFLYYDELDSAKNSIKYAKPDTWYKDFGNLVSQLAVANKELSMQNIDESGNFTRLNDYADVSAEILRILNDPQTMYSRYSSNLVIGPASGIDENKELFYQNLAPTGMHIYYPAINDSDYILEYLDAVFGSLAYFRDEAAKNALANYAGFIAQQALMVDLGYYVNHMIGKEGYLPDEVDYEAVKEFLSYGDGEGPTLWEERILPMAACFTGSEEAAPWMNDVIRQLASEYIRPENISVHSDREGHSFKVFLDNTSKRVVENVKAKVMAELPAAKEFLENDFRLGYYWYFHPEEVECCIRTLDGTLDSSDLDVDYDLDPIEVILEKTIAWYAKRSSVWNLEDPDNTTYAVQDANGSLHAVSVEALNRDELRAFFISPNTETGGNDYGYLVFEPDGNDYVLSKICLNFKHGDRLIPVTELTHEAAGVTMSYPVDIYTLPFALVPMSLTPFSVSPENAASIRLITTDIGNIPDIRDIDGDGSPITRRIAVTNIYQYDTDITDKTRTEDLINVKDLSVEPVTYNGKEQGPKVSYNGAVLKEGKDYVWIPADDSRLHADAGTYGIILIGTGTKYAGRTETEYSILPKKVSPTVTLSRTSYTYDGKAKKPGVTVKIGKTKLKAEQYSVSYEKGRKKVGAYKVTVRLKGNYSGAKTASFVINPPKTTITSLKKNGEEVTAKWKKVTAQTSGYQLQASLTKDFKKIAAKKTIGKNKTTSAVLKGLKKGRPCYVRIRTYKTVNGKKYYSKWTVKKS